MLKVKAVTLLKKKTETVITPSTQKTQEELRILNEKANQK